jgi:hypothetical protein
MTARIDEADETQVKGAARQRVDLPADATVSIWYATIVATRANQRQTNDRWAKTESLIGDEGRFTRA